MNELSSEKINEAINASNFNALIGGLESSWLDCKGQPYLLNTESGKRELAKDVSSFANAGGGKIIIGVKTKRSQSHFGDEIEEIRPIPVSLINPTQYKEVINSWVYPALSGINVTWIASNTEADKGICVIDIPPQKENLKPFLINKTLDGNKEVEIIFGYAERKGDASRPMSIEEIQAALRSGFHFENTLSGKLKGIETLLQETLDLKIDTERKNTNAETLKKRVEEAVSHGDLNKSRSIIITASPEPLGKLKSIFSDTPGSIKKQLEHPPRLRWAGWDLTHLDQPKIVRGDFIRATNGNAKVIDLYKDGGMIFAALADHNFLAWGPGEHDDRINSLALQESIYGFLKMYELVLDDFVLKPEKVSITIELRNLHLNSKKTYLLPYHLENRSHTFPDSFKKESPAASYFSEEKTIVKDLDPALLTHELASKIYHWFGFEDDKIPYTEETDGSKRFSLTWLKKN